MSSQVGDIAAALAYQVKKEIAENYFGTRRELEEEREDLLAQGRKIQKAWENEVRGPLLKVAELLMDEEAARSFRVLVGEAEQETAPALSPQRSFSEALDVCRLPITFTSRAKYRVLIERLYALAAERGRRVVERYNTLQKKIKIHNEEVTKFGTSYNLSEVLAFIKAIEGANELKGVLGENLDPRAVPELERKMALKPLAPDTPGLPSLEPLPEYKRIRDDLRALADRSFDRFSREIKACLKGEGG